MPAIAKCPQCGATLAGDGPAGSCPACLLALAIELPAEDPLAQKASAPRSSVFQSGPKTIRYFGDYELLEEIARGGMGVVYRARQVSLNRHVALKMIAAGQLATRAAVQRFHTEAEAAARLDHPHIVPIYEIGEYEGQHYFSMKLIEWGTLASVAACGENAALWRSRKSAVLSRDPATVMAKVARAVHYAHQRGILHRDLKPTNILIDEKGEPHVTDFGLAKLVEDDSSLTMSTAILGTPAYMSPEQASGKSKGLTIASDIYSLGAILYELLTGQPPIRAETAVETLRQVCEQEPTRPRTLNPAVDRDLETICLKCLNKDPQRRYGSAEMLADDLDRWRNHEPIQARPVNTAEKFWSWCRRRPAIAMLSSATGLLLLTVLIGSPIAIIRINRERQQTEHLLYVANMKVAQDAWEDNDVSRLRRLLEETRDSPDRGFEWYYWQRQIHPAQKIIRVTPENVISVAFSSEGRRIFGGIWDDHRATAKVWDAASGQELFSLTPRDALTGPVVFSQDGLRIAIGSTNGIVAVFDASNSQEIATLKEHEGKIEWLAFSTDGQRVATASRDQTAMVWDVATGLRMLSLKGHSAAVSAVAFSPDGRQIVTGGEDNLAKVWDAASGLELFALPRLTDWATTLAFSPDGRRILTGGRDQHVTVWDVPGRRALLKLEQGLTVNCVAFSPDGQRIVAASEDQLAKAWDATSGRELLTLKGHADTVSSVAFSPDGEQVVSAGLDGTVRVWDTHNSQEQLTLKGHTGAIRGIAVSPNGKYIASASRDHTARVWEAASGRELLTLKGHDDIVFSVHFSPDSQRIVTGSWDQTAKLWDTSSGRELLTFNGHTGLVRAVAFSPNGRQIVTGSYDHTAKVWETNSSKPLLTLKGHTDQIQAASFSPDGNQIITGGSDHTARIWDAATGLQLFELKGHSEELAAVAFFPDGQRVVTASQDKKTKVWNTATGRELFELKGHKSVIASVTVSPDGTRILTGSWDGTAKLWDVASAREVLTLKGHSGPVLSVAFSPDGQWIVTGNYDNAAKIWRAATPGEVRTWQAEERAPAQ